LESDRDDNLPSYGNLKETPKTINFISPYVVAKNILDSLNIPACDLIQLDVERYEYNVLVGAKNTIEKYKPVISAEVHTSGKGDEELLQFLKDMNYVRVDQSHADAIFVPNL
jgi:hypothetical protein